MQKYLSFLIPSFFVLFSFSCGKKGAIQPPVPKIPQKIRSMSVIQRGDRIILQWNNPTAYIDGSPLGDVSEVEIWLLVDSRELANKEREVNLRRFTSEARPIASLKKTDFSKFQNAKDDASFEFFYFYKLADDDFFSKKFTFSLRVKDRKKRKSGFSDFLQLIPVILPVPPRKPRAVAHKDRIEISWDSPAGNLDGSFPPRLKGYNVYRSGEEGKDLLINANLIRANKFDDNDFMVGKAYSYFIRASATDNPPYFESEDSETVGILVQDTFPPDPPTGLMSIAGENMIALSWNIVKEEDLAGYRVWRREEHEEKFIVLTPHPLWENAFNDTAVEKNKRYYYAITAVDKSGNESQKSEIISDVIIKEGFL